MKSFALLHPTSIFSTSPEYLHPEGTDKCKELLAYVDLLETNKPYLVNAVRVPALQTISLFSQSLDTNNDCTRLIADSWLELKFPSAEVGERVVERSKEDRFHDDFDDTSKTAALETLLASKLAEFLDSSFPYKLGQLSAAGKEHLYKGPPPDNQEAEAVSKEESKESDTVKPDMKRHPLKGGWAITDYLTYDCLDDGTSSTLSSSDHISRVWSCPQCEQRLAVTLVEQLQHQATCKKDMEQVAEQDLAAKSVDPTHLKSYHCPVCEQTLQLTPIDILKHKPRCCLQKLKSAIWMSTKMVSLFDLKCPKRIYL
ncbi:probable ATP-dependent RNA helicase DHX34 [Halichondria panicea]|uniref:probable ATP-dependent RNA helicase DHX34 n=1 Tax=Halichondria panicea TaxID=6063 RepID=UPI00312B4DCD